MLCVLALAPGFGSSLGAVGIAVGIIALIIGRKDAKRMIKEFDWNSLIFLAGIFGVIFTLSTSGLLADFCTRHNRHGHQQPKHPAGFPGVDVSGVFIVH